MKASLRSRQGISKSLFTLIAIAGVASVMSFTNPNNNAYVDYAANRLTSEIQNAVCNGPQLPQGQLWEGVSKLTATTCKSGLATGLAFQSSNIKDVITQSTERQNFFIFSIYTTKVPGYNFRTIGAFGNFLTFQK
ncbi:MAG: DUF4359 domain-containing protein [Fischerella sp.]|jgi:uncharacterized protein YceK|uniref:DUF4359 domain-containing protein n=1 Tax=Fischerella sp. TaxID=1191 RepID=UPI0017EC1AFE|nr:DUF4359 domain-containing protein [Fischerella sp.]NWF60517.1 DUF4359 domain-containing protein [Fischerella sp.]